MNDKSEANRVAKNGNNYIKIANKVACKKKRKNAVWRKALKRDEKQPKKSHAPPYFEGFAAFRCPKITC